MAAVVAVYAAANPNMDNYLQNTLGIENAALRGKLIHQGFNDALVGLSVKDERYVPKVATVIRRQGGVPAVNMSVDLEETLAHFVRWVKYRHLTQRSLALARATLDNIRAIGDWMKQLPDSDKAVDPVNHVR